MPNLYKNQFSLLVTSQLPHNTVTYLTGLYLQTPQKHWQMYWECQ